MSLLYYTLLQRQVDEDEDGVSKEEQEDEVELKHECSAPRNLTYTLDNYNRPQTRAQIASQWAV